MRFWGFHLKNPFNKIAFFVRQEATTELMRTQLSKLKKGQSTKGERRFSELLKKAHVPFQYKVKINGREIDFLIGNYAIEIDGHAQDVSKNEMLITSGYNPIHLRNWEIGSQLIRWLNTLWQVQH